MKLRYGVVVRTASYWNLYVGQEMEWVAGGLRNPGRKPRVRHELPPEIRIVEAPADRTLEGMLDSGEIDALIGPRVPEPMAQGSPHIVRLFPNYWEVEADYWRRTGLFPIMHTVVIKKEIVERHPWVAMNLLCAFMEAKRLTMERLADATAYTVPLPLLPAHLDTTRALMGEDFWPYGAEENRKTFCYLAQIAHEQHWRRGRSLTRSSSPRRPTRPSRSKSEFNIGSQPGVGLIHSRRSSCL